MRRTRIDVGFWSKIGLSALVVNIPLAIGLVVYGMPTMLAFGLSAACGVAILAIWDKSRTPQEAGSERLEPAVATTETPPASLRLRQDVEDPQLTESSAPVR